MLLGHLKRLDSVALMPGSALHGMLSSEARKQPSRTGAVTPPYCAVQLSYRHDIKEPRYSRRLACCTLRLLKVAAGSATSMFQPPDCRGPAWSADGLRGRFAALYSCGASISERPEPMAIDRRRRLGRPCGTKLKRRADCFPQL